MSETEFRHGKKRFYDTVKFPRGFAKSGDFTLSEEETLTRFGDTMQALETGELTPVNAEEKHFLKVLSQPHKAKSKLERVWLKYTQLSRGRRRFHTLNGSKRDQEPSEEYDSELALQEE
ncbi:DUF413 domain-containing protein [uncultured Vibrio sp.]|uniref:DUF413 domain-containing protein n=1 Tax=uncultured Vibrio sp. TaxID=114054 RepID=UPI00262D0414|nr:DUF413 domain-containing protein [uncultured Vibrio sp.]